MKKLGFTLSELLISIAIIAVIAVVTAPMLNNIKPDKAKSLLIKTHDKLMEINNELLNDPGIYASDGTCLGFECGSVPSDPIYHKNSTKKTDYMSTDKYPRLLANRLMSKNEPQFTKKSGNSSWTNVSLTTTDGVLWNIKHRNDNGHQIITVKIDINGDIGPNCIYKPDNSCQNPDQFNFYVNSKTGDVRPGDYMSWAYLMNKGKLNDHKTDLNKARELVTKYPNHFNDEN